MGHLKPNSVWSYKPWWCQPWSILLTGCSVITALLYFLPWLWLASLLAVPVAAWMIFFVGIYPRIMARDRTQHDPP
ncbi:DUF6737 family protein [Lyngbya confervoides]|uniref:DUF6737 domain-containing protein n=1 Tax=Lyngbya confervoides BDU141951 TaxID=1574623 RepID=A0ABD4T2A1_9CYAN|nr:DUF6737 family protein [Lyngbya confervoides]MCM1982779.1 hypothetical protein [Lyngbya confervoides BDU141951]